MLEPGPLEELYPILKPRDWGDDDVLRRSLAPELERESEWIPWIAVGWDRPAFVMFARPADVERLERDEDALYEAAMENLCAFEVEHEEIRGPVPGEGEITIDGYGGMFAAEKLLDEAFLRAEQERLGTELLAVGAPRRGMLLVTDGLQPPKRLAGFEAANRGQYRRAESPPVTPVVFAVQDGQVVGLLKSADDAPPDLSPIREPKGRYIEGEPITMPNIGCAWMGFALILGIATLGFWVASVGSWWLTGGAAAAVLLYGFFAYGKQPRVALGPSAILASPGDRSIPREDIEDVEWLPAGLRVHLASGDAVTLPGRFYQDAPERLEAWLDGID